MEALKRSVYEEIIIESTDGSKTVDIAPGTVMIDYYEDIFSPTLTAKLQVTNDGASIKGEDGTLQSIYNGLPLRGGETVTLKIKGNNEQNPGMDLSFFVSSISNVIAKKKTESFTLSGLRLVPYTVYPFSCKKFPMDLPIPDEPPVIKTIFLSIIL